MTRFLTFALLLSMAPPLWAARDAGSASATEAVPTAKAFPPVNPKGIPIPLPGQIVQDKATVDQAEKRIEVAAAVERLNLVFAERNAVAAEKQADAARAQTWINGVGTFIALLAALFLIKTWLETKRTADAAIEQARLANSEFIASHRPKIRVRNVVIAQPTPHHAAKLPLFAAGHPVRGQFYIENTGGTAATITSIGCWVYVTKKVSLERRDALPMDRPYEGKNPNVTLPGDVGLKAGTSIPMPFDSGDDILNEEAAHEFITATGDPSGWWHLYVMGYVEYLDGRNVPRRTGFCRAFVPNQQRFVKVDNDDYEHDA